MQVYLSLFKNRPTCQNQGVSIIIIIISITWSKAYKRSKRRSLMHTAISTFAHRFVIKVLCRMVQILLKTSDFCHSDFCQLSL